MTSIVFDTSVNVTNIATIVTGVVTLTIAWVKLGGRMDMIEYRVKSVEDAMKLMATALEKFAENDTDIRLLRQEIAALQAHQTSMHQTIEGLRRGEGWITGGPRAGITGEYPMPRSVG